MFSLENYTKINSSFFQRNTLDVCKDFIGSIIKFNTDKGKIIAKITEIEAYLGVNDKGSHTYNNRRTARTEPMFLDGGHLYVYFIYGMYYNLNFVTSVKNNPTGILLREIEILKGHNIASLNKYKKPFNELSKAQIKNLSNGPGKICQVLNIDRTYSGKHFSEVFEIYRPNTNKDYKTTARIGIVYAEEDALLPYRFLLNK